MNDSIAQSAAVPRDHAWRCSSEIPATRSGLGRIAPEPLDKFDIPEMVQVVGREPVCGHLLSIAAGVVIIGSVKRLMHVANEMQQEL